LIIFSTSAGVAMKSPDDAFVRGVCCIAQIEQDRFSENHAMGPIAATRGFQGVFG
jgi:hypothetical protein